MAYIKAMADLQTVVEMPEFIKNAERLLGGGERTELINYLAQFPEIGDVIKGSGGVRKVRWRIAGKGKSGGVRVITFYTGQDLPLFLLTVYGKGTKDTLDKAEVAAMRKLTRALKDTYGARS